ncbi:RNA-binding protein 5 [Oopsacas minuta]|uniref:RNA-binding protein 5 n=1 Tax=Oopsacas minuta TaxID=111878 RepID=A0AAV7K263_9METZ|nr:RNA-binding protein 5 [Oopsacas minuta]
MTRESDYWRYQDHPYEREYERELREFANDSDSKREGGRSRADERRIEALELKYRREHLRERDTSRREKLRYTTRSSRSRSGRETPEREVRRVRIVESLSPEPGLIVSPESSPHWNEKSYWSRSHSREREDAFWRRSRSYSEEGSPVRKRRSRSYSRERRRVYSRSPDRKQSKRNDNYRPKRSEHRSSKRSSRSRSREYREKTPQPSKDPSPLILLSNLPTSADRGDIEVSTRPFQTREIRILYDTDTRKSRGMGLIEFAYESDATAWLTQNKDSFYIFGEKITVEYTVLKAREGEWKCAKCNASNYSHRLVCYICSNPLYESEAVNQGSRPPELAPPSNVLILRGLKFTTTEEVVRAAICTISNNRVKDIRLIRDRLTKQSRGFCFVEFVGISEATETLDTIFGQDPAFFVDGIRTIANFARGNFTSNKPNQAALSAIEQGSWSSVSEQGPEGKVVTGGSKLGGEQEYSSKPVTYSTPVSSSSTESRYQYDPTSGYYYDSASGLYYDPNSKYHYDANSQKFCYYDPVQGSYVYVSTALQIPTQTDTPVVPAPTSAPVETEDSGQPKTKDKKKAELDSFSTSNTKQARRIAKDMERWAQKQNNTKSTKPVAVVNPQESETVPPAPPVLSGDFTLGPINLSLDTRAIPEVGISNYSSQLDFSQLGSSAATSAPLLPINAEPLYTDWDRLACLLCKRQFQSRDQLVKHQQLSDLHKQNLEKTQY